MVDAIQEIERIDEVAARQEEMLSLHTTYGVGGPCDLMVWVSTLEALKHTLTLCRTHSLPVTILGGGSNILVRDGGVDGAVIRLVDRLATVEVEENHLRAAAGASLGDLVSCAARAGLGGLEFLAGIPGTIGGAMATNAGAKDTWISSKLVSMSVINEELRTVRLDQGDVKFGYRSSGVNGDWVVTEALLAGFPSPVAEVRRRIEDHLDMRKATQPLGEKAAGCVFKNPPGDAAGRLIEQAGLKGLRMGGAEVSTIHANWIVNAGGATAGEILELIEHIQKTVKEVHGVSLELEIQILGRE
jgi:UDP-N-acetylmuramate dehydrogenase